ncbi:unnamed protein product [Parnassius apollo]|uniref:(apollo) hypothetical protein n=1 Tax=Parnassius apollo TaxID=110799 RepID=A0A8S3WU96_PARAO|nr:unnamed protein product [Parnassius apollo]
MPGQNITTHARLALHVRAHARPEHNFACAPRAPRSRSCPVRTSIRARASRSTSALMTGQNITSHARLALHVRAHARPEHHFVRAPRAPRPRSCPVRTSPVPTHVMLSPM